MHGPHKLNGASSIRFGDDDSEDEHCWDESLFVRSVGGGIWILQDRPMFGGPPSYGDTFEATVNRDGSLRFVRVIGRSPYRELRYKAAYSFIRSPAWNEISKLVLRLGGQWYLDFGVRLTVYVPLKQSSRISSLIDEALQDWKSRGPHPTWEFEKETEHSLRDLEIAADQGAVKAMDSRERRRRDEPQVPLVIPASFVQEAEAHLARVGKPLLRYEQDEYKMSFSVRPRGNGGGELAFRGSPRAAHTVLQNLLGGATRKVAARWRRFYRGRTAQMIAPIGDLVHENGVEQITFVEGPSPGSNYTGVWISALGVSLLQYSFDYFHVPIRITLARSSGWGFHSVGR